jgi:hypothetical protein
MKALLYESEIINIFLICAAQFSTKARTRPGLPRGTVSEPPAKYNNDNKNKVSGHKVRI